jgi:hypothetical protein
VENMNSNTETAQKPQQRFGMGTCPHALAPAVTSAIKSAVATPRPRTGMAAGFAEQHLALALAATGRGTWLRLSATKSMYTTLISAFGDGAQGSHPAREPV